MKIGMYTDEEILEHLTEGEGRGFLGRSMYDAIVEKINKKEAMYDSLAVDYRLAQEEIERLNNIINELEKWLDEEYQYADKHIFPGSRAGVAMGQIGRTKNKLQELKGVDKE